jgi:hypothetical protein
MADDPNQPLHEPAQPQGDEPRPEEDAARPLQFSLRSLLIAQAVCAALLALVIVLGIWAALLTLVVTAIVAVMEVRPEHAAGRRLIVDLSAGIVLPILCFTFDPGILFSTDARGAAASLVIGYQILLMATWQVVGRLTPRLNGFFAGGLSVGAVVATCIALMLTPLGVIGVVLWGLGLLAFTPWLTAWVFARNALRAWREPLAGGHGRPARWTVLAGLIAAVALPAAVYFTAADPVIQAMALAKNALGSTSSQLNPFAF